MEIFIDILKLFFKLLKNMKIQSIVEQNYEAIFKTSLVLNIEEKIKSSMIGSLHGSKKSRKKKN